MAVQVARAKVRYRSDIRFAMNRRMRDLMRKSLKVRGGQKSGKWQTLAGYSVADLEQHLRKTMPPGFAWQDFLAGRLHIDHIVPLAAFNFRGSDDFDFRRAWALSNLRLLPERENKLKGARLAAPFQPSLAIGR